MGDSLQGQRRPAGEGVPPPGQSVSGCLPQEGGCSFPEWGESSDGPSVL